MYTIDKHDRILDLPDVALPSTGAPDPLVLTAPEALVVSYFIEQPASTPDVPGQSSGDAAAAIVVFRQCYASHFGTPHDEAFTWHPLKDRGLRPFGAFQVEASSWLRELEFRNRGHPRHEPERFQQLRHWVWTFQDSVLECAALNYTVLPAQGRRDDLLVQMHAQLRSETGGARLAKPGPAA